MSRSRLVLALASAMLCIGSSRAQGASCESSVISTDRVVGFSGCISDEAAKAFLGAIRPETESIVLRSEGGSVTAALSMAKTIAASKLPVLIRGVCFSSCANYLMPAASRVSIEKNSIVGFHGDARLLSRKRDGYDSVGSELWTEVDRIAGDEERFSNEIPRVSRVHDAQSVALAPVGRLISVSHDGVDLSCPGHGLDAWFPTLPLLMELGVVDEIVEHDSAFLPQLPVTAPDELKDVLRSSASPYLTCRIQSSLGHHKP